MDEHQRDGFNDALSKFETKKPMISFDHLICERCYKDAAVLHVIPGADGDDWLCTPCAIKALPE